MIRLMACARLVGGLCLVLAIAKAGQGNDLITIANVVDPGQITADEPIADTFSAEKAARYLDTASLHWQKARRCATCHTNMVMQGQVRLVAATPESKGFTLLTPTSKFVDIGTGFTATVTPEGLSRVEVSEGEVDVVLEDIKSSPRVRSGETLCIEPGERRVVTRIERGDWTAAFHFPTIEPPSREDYADQTFGHASIRVVQGRLNTYVAGPVLLTCCSTERDSRIRTLRRSLRFSRTVLMAVSWSTWTRDLGHQDQFVFVASACDS
jgi:hypothetical protein